MKGLIPRSAFFLLFAALTALAWGRAPSPLLVASVASAELPREARETLRLIRDGGPFPYRKDGVVFQNRENRLPPQEPGYYREFTVPTPGLPYRGPRRIVAGKGSSGDIRTSGEYYYTADHYRTFRRITE